MLQVGATAPEFTAPTHDGRTLALTDLKGHPVVLYFYPAADTPGCTREAEGFRDAYEEYRRRGVAIVGVSVDPVDAQRAFAVKCALPFPLVADPSKEIARRYGVLGPHGTARRVTFLLDGAGRVTSVIDSRDVAEHLRAARATLGTP